MVSHHTIVFVVQVLLTCVPNINTLESIASGPQSNTTLCNVCWSLASAGQCQNTTKSEPCSPEQLDSAMGKIRLIHASKPEQASANSTINEHQSQQYRCFTLSASSGIGESKKVFYAKGCTTMASDLCAGWVKEKSATCALCTGNNCNAAAPIEISHSAPIKLNNKTCTSSNSNRAALVNSSFHWMVGITALGSLCSTIFAI
ncbi:uncharacterized protein LOC128302520 [Anopheles moucheti]|uniref:uncharacterized protein LOC128302520 n=1 Tax=Anopheles moucheti TaxID=186751 RepID=UPI0022F059CB|nr:uncharacterized protein LOC128302520 [Anopheles moucheti]